MNLESCINQFNLYDHQIIDFMGHKVLQMPTHNAKYPNVYGKVRLAVMLRSLPCVLAFIKSDGESFDPTTLTDDEIEMIINHIETNCRPNHPEIPTQL
jgi:hypothetical protein